jgi:phosphate/sulfate permease
MSLLGAGLIGLRHSIPDADSGLLIVGVVVLMPGLGFIISAGITWFLARHLGLMPNNRAQE